MDAGNCKVECPEGTPCIKSLSLGRLSTCSVSSSETEFPLIFIAAKFGVGGLAALLAGAGGGQGGGGGLAALLGGAGGGQGGGGGLAALLGGAGGGQGGGLAALLGGAGQGSGGNSASKKGGSDLAGMMVVAAMIGAQLATDSKPDQPTASSGGDGPEEPGDFFPLNMINKYILV